MTGRIITRFLSQTSQELSDNYPDLVERFSQEDWRDEVQAKDTRLGYVAGEISQMLDEK